jgi:predicted dehydrogenase
LLLEKPLALDVASAEAVAAAVQEAGVATLVFFTSRFRPEVERWTQAAADAGPWHSAHLVHYANIFEPSGPYATSVWRREYGALWDVGPHGLAALLPIMGPVASVAARSGPAGSDTVHLILSHADPGQPAPRELAIEVAALDALETVADVGTLSESATTALPPLSPLAVELTAGPACMSTMSLSLTMPPAAAASQLSIYGDHGVRSRPEASFDVVEVFRSAVAELAMLVRTGERAHSCDVGFGLEVVRALAAAERAMDLPGIDLG